MSSLYFTGASENQPALQWCTIGLWRIGTTLLPFDTEQFKAARRDAVGPESIGVGDEGFTQVDDGHAACIQMGKPDKDAAIAIYRAMEQTLKDSVS